MSDHPARHPAPGPERPTVWLLTNAPSAYQCELFAAVSAAGEAALSVRFMRRSPHAPALPFEHRYMAATMPARFGDECRIHPRALYEALTGSYDCWILSGLYTSPTFLLCAAILALRRRRWAAWLEQPRPRRFRHGWASGGTVAGLTEALRSVILRWIMRHASTVIGIGSIAVERYREFGLAESKALMLPYCCNVTRFAQADPVEVAAIRQSYGLAGKTVYLFSGQMIHRKGVDTLLKAFETVAASRPDVAMLLLGDGALRQQLEASVPPGLRDRVHFTGFLPQAELPAYFAAADAFVFLSRHDGWGVVINEACGAGLPLIVSRQAGASGDLVREGENGFVVDADDASSAAARMIELADRPDLTRSFGARSRQIVERFSPGHASATLKSHIMATIRKSTVGAYAASGS